MRKQIFQSKLKKNTTEKIKKKFLNCFPVWQR